MDVYRKIAVAKSSDDLKQIESELADVYGAVPEEVELVLQLAELRIRAAKRNIKSIIASGQDLIFSFDKDHGGKTESLFVETAATVKIPDPRTVCLQLGKNYFEPKTLINVLRKMLNR
jgi:transcription-repair coupling factor (superfamily II helicase)